MTTAATFARRLRLVAAVALVVALAPPTDAAKDVGPSSAACDAHQKGSRSWQDCVGAAHAGIGDAEAFYAGYWLARAGRYEEALTYLRLPRQPDARVLTYIGFATRKLGDIDAAMPYYRRALEIDPGYSVARAYLGEAHLSRAEPEPARAELAEIARRCGTSCAEYLDLAGHIARYERARDVRG